MAYRVQNDSISTGAFTVDEIFDLHNAEGDSCLNLKASIGWSESTNRGACRLTVVIRKA
jgi:outer membrane protein insertion porin family